MAGKQGRDTPFYRPEARRHREKNGDEASPVAPGVINHQAKYQRYAAGEKGNQMSRRALKEAYILITILRGNDSPLCLLKPKM